MLAIRVPLLLMAIMMVFGFYEDSAVELQLHHRPLSFLAVWVECVRSNAMLVPLLTMPAVLILERRHCVVAARVQHVRVMRMACRCHVPLA